MGFITLFTAEVFLGAILGWWIRGKWDKLVHPYKVHAKSEANKKN